MNSDFDISSDSLPPQPVTQTGGGEAGKPVDNVAHEIALDKIFPDSEEVPLRPDIDPERIKQYIATFIPEPERKKISLADLAAKRDDNPRDVFDNRPSNVPWDDTGRFNSPEEMMRLINMTTQEDPFRGRCLGAMASIGTCGIFACQRLQAVPEGQFAILQRQTATEIRLQGEHLETSILSNWAGLQPIDDEEHLMRRVGNKTILKVPANYLGTASLHGDKYKRDRMGQLIKGDDGQPILIGRDGDRVLFSQGSYVLDETEYHAINVGVINPKERIIDIGNVVILNIPEGYVGGALNRGTMEYEIFQTGAPLVFDEKEWMNFEVVERKRDTFKVGPWVFLTVSANEVACVGNKNGEHMLLTEEATYRFHEKDWQTFDKHSNDENFEVGAYTVRSVAKDQLGTVFLRNKAMYSLLKPGNKYFLYNKEYEKPEVVNLHQPLSQCGPLHIIRVQEDYRTGGFHQKTGCFDEWTETGKLVIVHRKDYPKIERIKAVLHKEQKFGPQTVITVPEGKWAVWEDKGEIVIKEHGTFTLPHGATLKDPIPTTPQQFYLDVSFLTSDGLEMTVSTTVHYTHNDAKALAKKLNSDNVAFGIWRSIVKDQCEKVLQKRLKTYGREALYNQADQEATEKLHAEITESCMRELNAYAEQSKYGIDFGRMTITSDFKIVDKQVLQNLANLEKAKLNAAANIAQAEANREAAKAEAVAEIELAEKAKQVRLKQEQAETEAEKLRLERERLDAEQRFQLEIEEKKAAGEAIKVEAQAKAEAKKTEAEAAAYEKQKQAEAEYALGAAQNRVAEERPKEELELQVMEKYVEAMRAMGTAAWKHPDQMAEVARLLGTGVKASDLLTLELLSKRLEGSDEPQPQPDGDNDGK